MMWIMSIMKSVVWPLPPWFIIFLEADGAMGNCSLVRRFCFTKIFATVTLKYFNIFNIYYALIAMYIHIYHTVCAPAAPAQDGDVHDLATRCLYIRSTFASDRAVGLEATGPMEHEEMTEVVFWRIAGPLFVWKMHIPLYNRCIAGLKNHQYRSKWLIRWGKWWSTNGVSTKDTSIFLLPIFRQAHPSISSKYFKSPTPRSWLLGDVGLKWLFPAQTGICLGSASISSDDRWLR